MGEEGWSRRRDWQMNQMRVIALLRSVGPTPHALPPLQHERSRVSRRATDMADDPEVMALFDEMDLAIDDGNLTQARRTPH